jgi:hypothetical protein
VFSRVLWVSCITSRLSRKVIQPRPLRRGTTCFSSLDNTHGVLLAETGTQIHIIQYANLRNHLSSWATGTNRYCIDGDHLVSISWKTCYFDLEIYTGLNDLLFVQYNCTPYKMSALSQCYSPIFVEEISLQTCQGPMSRSCSWIF